MKMRKTIAVILTAFMLTAVMTACSKDSSDDTTAAPEAVDTVNENPVETETESTFVEPAVAFNHDAYSEFAEPVYYDVTADAPAYADVGLNSIAMTYVQGSMVMGVATDGYYIVLDSGYVVDGQYLEAVE